MKFKIFTYPVPPPEDPAELNSFLSSARVLSVSQYKCRSGSSSCLVFVVEYLEGKTSGQKGKPQPRVDYRETLSDGDFTLFSAYLSVLSQNHHLDDTYAMAYYYIN